MQKITRDGHNYLASDMSNSTVSGPLDGPHGRPLESDFLQSHEERVVIYAISIIISCDTFIPQSPVMLHASPIKEPGRLL